MRRFILSICSGDALNEYHFFKDKRLDPDISFIFYDPIYRYNVEIRCLITDLYKSFYPLNFVYFCADVNEVRCLLESKCSKVIFLIGFNIQELYPIIFNHNDIDSYISQKRKEQGLLSLCSLIPERDRDLKVHIQMEDRITFDNFDSFYQDLILNS